MLYPGCRERGFWIRLVGDEGVDGKIRSGDYCIKLQVYFEL
jgi:hypothetical protein